MGCPYHVVKITAPYCIFYKKWKGSRKEFCDEFPSFAKQHRIIRFWILLLNFPKVPNSILYMTTFTFDSFQLILTNISWQVSAQVLFRIKWPDSFLGFLGFRVLVHPGRHGALNSGGGGGGGSLGTLAPPFGRPSGVGFVRYPRAVCPPPPGGGGGGVF
jgi:hypothetical protein